MGTSANTGRNARSAPSVTPPANLSDLSDAARQCKTGGAPPAASSSRRTARDDFETAWRVFLSKRAEADYQAWRDQEAWAAEKYRRFDRGERMPHDWRG